MLISVDTLAERRSALIVARVRDLAVAVPETRDGLGMSEVRLIVCTTDGQELSIRLNGLKPEVAKAFMALVDGAKGGDDA